jgi:hypothetical protein
MIDRPFKAFSTTTRERMRRMATCAALRKKNGRTLMSSIHRLGRVVLAGSLLLAAGGPTARAAEVEIKTALESASDVTLAVPGKGVRFPDGSVQVTAKPSYKRTVVVCGLGTPGENGTALLAALAAITNATADSPWLLKLEPGIYDLGASHLEMKAYVDIEGAGENLTRITGKNDHPTQGVVMAASDAALRMLTVEHTGGGTSAIALSIVDAETRMVRVRATASGATTNIGIFNDNNGLPRLSYVTIEAMGGTAAYGIKTTSAGALLSNVTVSATGGATSCAVSNASSETTLRDVTATASGGTNNTAISNDDSYIALVRVVAAATGGTKAVAVYNSNGTIADMLDTSATAMLATDVNTAVETSESSAIMRRVQAEAKGPGTCHGILNTDAEDMEMDQVNAFAAEGTVVYGIRNDNTPVSLNAVTASAAAAAPSPGYGLYLFGEGYEGLADGCAFSGTSYSVHKPANVVMRMGACRLEGPVNEVEQYQCAECFDETAFPLNDACQADPL